MSITLGKTRKKLSDIRDWLNEKLIEREDEIRGCLVGLIASEHVFMIGPPGTAKSILAECVCASVEGSRYFGYLMNKFTAPEDLFGQISVKKMDEEDVYERKTEGMIPESNILFLDEIWKANSAINNALLKITNERIYRNGTKEMRVPLVSMICASNEFPEGDELGAIYDRIAFKFKVDYVSNENFFQLLNMSPIDAKDVPKITFEELRAVQKEALSMHIPDEVIKDLLQLRTRLNAENIRVSDRKWRQAENLLRAYAFLCERKGAVTRKDLFILKDVLWVTEDQINKVTSIVLDIADPAAKVALDFSNELQSVLNAGSYNSQDECAEVIAKVKDIRNRIKVSYADSQSPALKDLLSKIDKHLKDLSEKLVRV